MAMQRFIKKCEEFTICASTGDENTLFTDGYPENIAIYHITTIGNIKMAKPFVAEYVTLDSSSNKFVDVKSYLFEQRVYLSSTPYKLYGFNSHDTDQDWNGNLVTESFTGDDNSWLICFSGNPTINGVEMNELDYAKLTSKDYTVNLNGAVVAIFTKV